MYEIIHFRGGLYKFDELSEYIEDIGGLVFNRDHFEIIRGTSYLSTEVHVLLMIPENELEQVNSIINEIKGMYENIEITQEQKNNFFAFLSIYDVLNKTDSWIEKEELKESLVCPCLTNLCKISEDNECILNDKFNEILEEMITNKIIEFKIDDNKIFYRLNKAE